MLASAGNDQVYLWHIRSAKLIKKFNKEKRTIVLIVCSHDNQIIAQVKDYNELKLMRMKQGGIIRKFRKYISQGDNLLFSPDGSFLALQKIFDEIILWNLQVGKQKILQRCMATQIQFSNNSKFIFAGYRNGVILCWSLQDLTEIDEVKTSLNCVDQLVFSPRRQILVACGTNGISFIDTQTFSEVQFYNTSNIQLVSFLQNGKTLTFRQDQQDSIIRIIEDNEDLQKTRFQYTWQIAISPCANLLARVWKNKIELLSLKKAKKIINNTQKVDGVESVSISPNGQLFTFTHSNDIYVWNIKDKQYTGCIGVKYKFYPDGQFIFVEGRWHHSYWQFQIFKFHQRGKIQFIAFSFDSNTLFSCDWKDHQIWVWNLENGQKKFELQGHSDRISIIAFSPDGQIFASSDYNSMIKLWSYKNLEYIQVLKGQLNHVISIQFSFDGYFLISGSWDKSIRFWSVLIDQQIYVLNSKIMEFNQIQQSYLDGLFKKNLDFKQLYLHSHMKNKFLLQHIKTIGFKYMGSKIQIQIHELQGHQGIIKAFDIFHSGILLAVGGNNKIVYISNLNNQFKVHENTITFFTFYLNDSISSEQDF